MGLVLDVALWLNLLAGIVIVTWRGSLARWWLVRAWSRGNDWRGRDADYVRYMTEVGYALLGGVMVIVSVLGLWPASAE